MANLSLHLDKAEKRLFEIGSDRGAGWPSPEMIKHYFCDFEHLKWLKGGSEEAVFRAHGVRGTSRLPVGKGRINNSLVFTLPPHHQGLYVCRSEWGGTKAREDYYCLWDDTKLGNNFLDSHNDYPMSNALVIPHKVAFQVLKEYIESDGGAPKCIDWVEAEDLPPSALPVPEDQM